VTAKGPRWKLVTRKRSALLRLPESPGRLRNGAYVGQWWLFAAFTLFMAFRIARDIGIDEAEVAEITPERPSEST